MNCEQVKELILTDYIDGRLSDGQQREFQAHLKGCPSCEAMAKQVRADIQSPLQNVGAHRPDDFLWTRIKRAIEQEQPRVRTFDRPRFIFALKPALILAATVLVMAVSVSLVRLDALNRQAAGKTVDEQVSYIASLMQPAQEQDSSIGTDIETYFL